MKTTMTMKAARGQTIRTDYGRDNSSYDEATTQTSKMGGSVTNLSHSISGASAKQDGNASKDKPNGFA